MSKKNVTGEYSDSFGLKSLSSLIENISDVIFLLDDTGVIKFVNPSVTQVLGYKVEECIGKNIFGFVHQEDLKKVQKLFLEILSSKIKRRSFEYRLIDINGHDKTVFGKLTDTLQNSNLRGILLTIQDITDRVLKEEEILKRDILLNHAEKISQVGGWVYDVSTDKITWTEETYRIHEIEPFSIPNESDQLIEASLPCYYEKDREIIFEAFQKCINEGIPYDLEFPFITKRGNNLWIRTMAKPIFEKNKVVKIYGNIVDISEMKRIRLLDAARIRLVEYSYKSDLDAFMQKFLDEAEALTNSKIGFYHFVEADQETLLLQMWSTNTVKTMCTAEGKGSHYNISQAGVWVDCVKARHPIIHNDYANLPHKKGLPEGHAPVIRELVVPVFRNDKVISILGVGNKETNYDEHDIELVSGLADFATDITERKRAENSLIESEQKLLTVLNSNHDRIWAIDKNYNLLYGNETYTNYIFIQTGEYPAKGDSIFKNTPFPSFISEWEGYFKRALNGEIFKIEKSYNIRKEDFFVEYGFNPVKGLTGEYESIVVYARDITDRKNYEKGLQLFNEEQKKINEELRKKNAELRIARKATLNIIDDLSNEIEDHKRTLADLNESNFRYNELALRSRTVTWGVDLNGLYTFVSSVCEAVYGYTQDEIINKLHYFDLHPEEGKQEFIENTMKFIKAGEQFTNYENKIQTKDGEVIWVLTNGFPIYDDGGILIGLQGTDVDITEWKKTKDELFETKSEYQNFVERSNEGIYFIEYNPPIDTTLPVEEQIELIIKKGVIRECNLAQAKMYGYKTHEELIGKSLFELYGNEISEVNYNTTKEFISKHYQIDNEETIEFDNEGNVKYFLNSVLGVVKGKYLTGNWGTQRDNTQRKTVEIALQHSEQRYKTLFEEHSAVKLLIDTETGKILDANQAASEFYGWTREQLKSMGLSDINPLPQEQLVDAVNEVLTKRRVRFEFTHKLADGTLRDVEVFSSRIEIDGRLHLHSIIHDITDRKIAEIAMRESEEKYRKLVEDSPDAIAIYSEGKIVFLNNATLKLMQVSKPEELLGQSVIQYVHPDSLEMVKSRIQKTQLEKVSVPVAEEKFILPNGKVVDVEVVATPITFNNEDAVQLIVRDISERKKAEEKIIQLSRAVEQSPVSIVITDLNGNIEYANSRTFQVTGYSPEELLGKNPRIFSSGELPSDSYKKLWETISSGQEWKGEFHNKKKNGKLFWEFTSISPIKDDNGNFSHYLAVKEDITERKKSEQALRENERKYRQLINNLHAGVVVHAPDTSIILYNQEACELLGLTPAQMEGRSAYHPEWRFVNEVGEPVLVEDFPVNKVISTKEPLYYSTFGINNPLTRNRVWVQVNAYPEFDDLNELTQVVVTFTDITARKNSEVELIEARDAAERANRLKDAFIANMSHEIRTPLNGILGMTSIIKETFERFASEDEKSYFTSIEISSKRLMKTVELIMNYSRLEVGDYNINPENYNLNESIQNTIDEYLPIALEKHIILTYKSSIGNLEIFADEYSVTTSIVNIIDNAVKFTEQGFVNVTLSKNEKNEITLDIEDTGVGISEEYLPNIFVPYTQEESGYNRAYEGVGLGLSLVKKFLDLNKIRIKIESKKNIGSKFTLIFDKSRVKEIKSTSPAAHIAGEIKKVDFRKTLELVKSSILIVEDDGINQLYLKSILSPIFDIDIASSGAKALKAFEENDYDLILMDISLRGGMNGLEVTKIIRSGNKNPKIPIIAVTGHAFPEDRQKTNESGCDDYLSKPFEAFELLEKINQYLG